VGIYNGTDWSFNQIEQSPSYVHMSAIIPNPEGKLWIGSYNSGLFSFQDEMYTKYSTANSALSYDYIPNFAKDNDGSLWFSSRNQICHFIDGELLVMGNTDFDLDAKTIFLNIVVTNDGNKHFLFSGLSDGNGYILYNDGEWSIQLIEHPYSLTVAAPEISLMYDKSGVLCMITPHAFYNFVDGVWDDPFEINFDIYGNPSGWADTDSEGNIWIGSPYNLYKYDGTDITEIPFGEFNPSNRKNTAVMVDSQDNVWLTFDDGKILTYDGSEFVVDLSFYDETILYPSYRSTLFQDDQNTLWLGFYSGGNIGLYKKENEVWIPFTVTNSGIASNFVEDIEQDVNGNLWIAHSNNRSGISIFNENGIVSNVYVEVDDSLLGNIYPNPAREQATIRYKLTEPTRLSISIFDTTGKKCLDILEEKHQVPGDYQLPFTLPNQQSGVYFVVFKDDKGKVQTQQLILLKE
jgi:streptogramin lyase